MNCWLLLYRNKGELLIVTIETRVNCWCTQQHNYSRMWPHNYGYLNSLKIIRRPGKTLLYASNQKLHGGEEVLGKSCCMQAIKTAWRRGSPGKTLLYAKTAWRWGRPGNDVTLEFVLNKMCCTFRVQTAFTSLSDKQKCGKSSFIQRLHIRRMHVIITCRHAQFYTNCIIKRNYKFMF